VVGDLVDDEVLAHEAIHEPVQQSGPNRILHVDAKRRAAGKRLVGKLA
jgi:hypothetical protein